MSLECLRQKTLSMNVFDMEIIKLNFKLFVKYCHQRGPWEERREGNNCLVFIKTQVV